MIWRMSRTHSDSCLGFSSAIVAGHIVEHPPGYFLILAAVWSGLNMSGVRGML